MKHRKQFLTGWLGRIVLQFGGGGAAGGGE